MKQTRPGRWGPARLGNCPCGNAEGGVSLTAVMLENLLTEQPNPASEGIDALPTSEILKIINREDGKVADAVAKELPSITRAVDAITESLARGGHLFYLGAGTSGRLGVLDA